jgi:hypothetical protein
MATGPLCDLFDYMNWKFLYIDYFKFFKNFAIWLKKCVYRLVLVGEMGFIYSSENRPIDIVCPRV